MGRSSKSQALLDQVVAFYLASPDFNGLPLQRLLDAGKQKPGALRKAIGKLIQEGKVSVEFGDRHVNPHILAFDPDAPDAQLDRLERLPWAHACAYPTTKYLGTVVKKQDYDHRPFTLELALGRPQLSYHAFDISVLENYRNDPRYSYRIHDRGGAISVHDDHYLSDEMKEHDKVLLETFGFGFDKDNSRAVIVFLVYLARLSPEHQAIWHAKRLDGDYKMHPDYYRPSILGEFPEKLSLFEAFLMELREISTLSALMGRPSLFRETWGTGRPRGFGWIVRPTKNELDAFVHLLDKMMGDNISRDFFKDDISLESETTRADGKVVVREKGTINLLQEWISTYFRPVDPSPMEELFEVLKEIRKRRQKPAHAVEADRFDRGIFEQQRLLMVRAYGALRTIRLVLQNHPATRGHKVRDDLAKGLICSY